MMVYLCGFHQKPIVKPKTQQCDLCVATELLEDEGYRVAPTGSRDGIRLAREILEASGYEVISPDEVVPPPEPPNQERQERRRAWLDAWCATASASSLTQTAEKIQQLNQDLIEAQSAVCTQCADACLEAFDERFTFE